METVCKDLHGREQARLGTQLTELIHSNTTKGNPPYGFLYGGQYYTILAPAMRRTAVKKIIHPELREEAREFVEGLNQWQKDWEACGNALRRGLQSCHDWQDVRDIFPTVIGMIHEATKVLKRTRPVGFPFEGMALQMTQFNMAVTEPLEYHASNRMF